MSNFKKQLIKEGVYVGIVLVIFSVFFILFRLNIIHQTEIISGFKNKKNAVSNSINELSFLVKDWEIAKKYKKEITQLVPKKDNLVLLPKELQAIAKGSGVNLSFSFVQEGAPQSSGNLNSISFNALVNGDMEKILNFFSEVEKNYFSIKISNFDLLGPGQENNARVTFNGSVYFY